MSTIDLTDAVEAAARAQHERAGHRIAVLPIPVHSGGTGSR